ncbi:MAG TPA: glycosyltransferase family 2 protein [Methylomirabilota bacterium]|nr:glycosyltransferase family 2 protein [Methylomirabilota bacterium]
MSGPIELSVVIPMLNEADNVQLLWEELDAALARIALRTEIIFVDDGSTDATAGAVRAVMKSDPRVRLLRFEANAGLTAAFHAGYGAARGEIVVTIDADLQNDPRDIERLLAALKDADAAVGYRRRRHDRWRKRIASRIANAVRNRLTGEDIRDSACSLRAMRRECLAAIPPYSGMHRFVPTLLRMAGFRVVEVPVSHRPRHLGRSKFGVWDRAVPAFVDLLVVRWMMRRTFRGQSRDVTQGEDDIG